jgi:hypothetical protein
LFHAKGIAPVAAAGGVGEADPFQRLANGPLDVAGGQQRLGGGAAQQVLPAGEERVKPRPLNQSADLRKRLGGAVRQRVAEQLDRAGGWRDEAEQHPDGRRLA